MYDRRDFLKTTVAASSVLAISSVPRAFAAGIAIYLHQGYSRYMGGKKGQPCSGGDDNRFKN